MSGHRLGDETANALGGVNKVTVVGQGGVAHRRAVTPELADLRQVLAGHDGVVRYGEQVMQAQPAEPRPPPHGAPVLDEAVDAPAFGKAQEQEQERRCDNLKLLEECADTIGTTLHDQDWVLKHMVTLLKELPSRRAGATVH